MTDDKYVMDKTYSLKQIVYDMLYLEFPNCVEAF